MNGCFLSAKALPMRNLMEYPITHEEKIKVIDRLYTESLRTLAIGDITAAVLLEIRQDLYAAIPDQLVDR